MVDLSAVGMMTGSNGSGYGYGSVSRKTLVYVLLVLVGVVSVVALLGTHGGSPKPSPGVTHPGNSSSSGTLTGGGVNTSTTLPPVTSREGNGGNTTTTGNTGGNGTTTSSSVNVGKNTTNSLGDVIQIFPLGPGNFTVIGSYLQQSRYGMTEIQGLDSSLMVSPFLWNVKSARGYTTLYYDGDSLNVTVSMNSVHKISPQIPVLGYPGVMYGQEPWFPFNTTTREYPQFTLPQRLGNLSLNWSVLDYRVFNGSGQGTVQDFSYDIWITPREGVTSLTQGDIEVMVWFYSSQNLSGAPYFTQGPTLDIPTLINSSVQEVPYKVYILNYSGGGWTLVVFQSEEQLKQGQVGVPLGRILSQEVPEVLGSYAGWKGNLQGYYLDAIQVGEEFNTVQGGSVDVGYDLYSWYVTV